MPRIAPRIVEPALRASGDPLAAELLARLEHDAAAAVRATTTRPFSRQAALRIYQHKAAKGDRPGVRTDGYPALLAALGAAPGGAVIVHGVTFADAVYLVFTDPSRTDCLGLLRKRWLQRGA